MAKPKGSPKTGGGSRKGKPNKITADLKQMILGALDQAGGIDYLRRQAAESPAAFLTLIGKVLPKEQDVNVTHSGMVAHEHIQLSATAQFIEEAIRAGSEGTPTKPLLN